MGATFINLAIILLCVSGAFSANILAVLPVFIKSHSIFTHAITRELANRGHHVTILTPFEDADPPPNYRQVIADKRSCWEGTPDEAEREMFLNSKIPLFIQHIERWKSMLWFTEAAFNSSSIQDFIKNDKSHFDLVITELFIQEAFLMFGHKYNAPVVMLSSFGSGHYINDQMGNPLVVSAVPFEFIEYFGTMNVWQRIKNSLFTFGDLLGRKFYYLPLQQDLAELHFADLPKPLPKVSDLERNVSLMLMNTHFSVDTIKPNVPAMIEVGGIHIKPPKELPKDLKSFMDGAKDGVVFFSLGTIVKSSELSQKKIEIITSVFGNLTQRVLWKWDGDDFKNLPSNIKLAKWLPQTEILSHPKTVLFITHGGLLGGQEAIYYGVPVIGMPFYGDQFLNVKKAVRNGYGLELLYRDLTQTTFSEALNTVINNPSFREKAKDASRRFRDKPQTPLETAMFWIEYVLRHKGAAHMRSPILDLRWYEYLLLDVAAVLIIGISSIGIAAYCLIFVIWKLLTFRKPSKRNPKYKTQ